MLPFEDYVSQVISFLSNNIFVAIGLAVIFLLFLWKKPIECIKCIGVVLLIIVALYIMTLLTQSGKVGESFKHDSYEKSDREIHNE